MAEVEPADGEIERRTLGAEHAEVTHLTARVEATAEMAGNLAAFDLDRSLRDTLDAVQRAFVAHAEWEDSFCYPRLDRSAGTTWATRALRLQHQQIRAHVDRLEADWLTLRHEPTHRQLVDLRARLYGLAALLTAHFEQEEHLVLLTTADEQHEPVPEDACEPATHGIPEPRSATAVAG